MHVPCHGAGRPGSNLAGVTVLSGRLALLRVEASRQASLAAESAIRVTTSRCTRKPCAYRWNLRDQSRTSGTVWGGWGCGLWVVVGWCGLWCVCGFFELAYGALLWRGVAGAGGWQCCGVSAWGSLAIGALLLGRLAVVRLARWCLRASRFPVHAVARWTFYSDHRLVLERWCCSGCGVPLSVDRSRWCGAVSASNGVFGAGVVVGWLGLA